MCSESIPHRESDEKNFYSLADKNEAFQPHAGKFLNLANLLGIHDKTVPTKLRSPEKGTDGTSPSSCFILYWKIYYMRINCGCIICMAVPCFVVETYYYNLVESH